MHSHRALFSRHPIVAAVLLATALLTGCGGGGSSSSSSSSSVSTTSPPSAPVALGFVDRAPLPTVAAAFVDTVNTNQRNNPCWVTPDTNAGIRVVSKFLDLWSPRVNPTTGTVLVDAGVTLAASGTCAAVTSSDWSGIPGSATDGSPTTLGQPVLAANIAYVETATATRTADQELAAYLDDRRGKGYSVSDGMGPLTTAWRTGAQQTTTITSIPADATTVLYNEGGNNTGVATTGGNTAFGSVVDLVNSMGNNGSTEPAKRFFKYARPWRWSSNVVVVPALVPAKSSTPATDGGFVSGHTAEAFRDAVGMAYAVPERFQEMLTRASELGENRILSGMHSPLDVIGGRIQGSAVAIANLYDNANTAAKAKAYADAHAYLQAQAGVTSAQALNDYAHSATTSTDRFADHDTNEANYVRRMTFGFSRIGTAGATALVPKGAEVVLETRLPYLTAEQRRVVLKTTAFDSGYPGMDDAEGWGRLNLFAAADGYGAFTGDVTVAMDATLGGFSAVDTWRNDISGTGILNKQGTGTLKLAGVNSWSGGTIVAGGVLSGMSATAFGAGDVYVSTGTLQSNVAGGAITIAGKLTVLDTGTLDLVVGSGSAGRLAVSGQAHLGGTLHVGFRSGYTPKAGDTITVLTTPTLQGTFKTITVDGFSKTTATYTPTGSVQLVLSN
jgi:autotransporter-associated beta strand protein